MDINVNEGTIHFGDFTNGRYNNIDIPEYDLVLAKITEEEIAELHNIRNFILKRSVLGTDTISFEVPKFIANNQGQKQPNPLFDLVEGNRLVLLDGVQYFILSKPRILGSAQETYKSITGFSREYELTQRLLNGYEGVSRVLYDYSNTIDENGLEVGFINYIENNTSWSLGYINKEINKRHRMLKLNTNIYKALEEVQKTFGCVFQFDTVNKLINVYDPMQLGVNQGVYITDENYINEINQEIEDENIVTRLYLYGHDNISIQSLTVTGQPYLEDFSYFRNTNFMSEGLLAGLDEYDAVFKENDGVFQELLVDKKDLLDDRVKVVTDLREKQGDLRILEHEWDLAVADDADLTDINAKIDKQKSKIRETQKKLDDIDLKVKSINDTMHELKSELQLSNFLSKSQLKEFDYFIKEERYYDQNYTEENLEELLEEGQEVLRKVSRPHITFNVAVDDFMTMAQGRFMWDKLILGDIINLEHKDIGFDYEVRLIGYTHKPDDRHLELQFSSIDNVYDSALYLEQLLEDAADMSSVVDFNKFKWDKGEDVDNAFSDYINHNLDLSNQALAKEDGQRPILDDRGLWLYKEMPDGRVSPEQVRAIHNVIAITKDNWETLEVAITPNGVMANQLIGQVILGTDLKIISDSGVVEILNNVINIRDDKGRLRVALGNYKDGKYGLRLTDSEGRNTVLDEDGMLQVWQEGRTDNVDKNNGLSLYVYLPDTTRIVYKALLRFRREEFRSYSDTTSNDGAVYSTTGGGGGVSTSTGAGGYHSTTTGDGGGTYSPSGLATDVSYGTDWTYPGGKDGHQHEFMLVVHHKHQIEIDDHYHSYSVPDHRHSISLRDHHHSVEVDAHDHDIIPVIYKHRGKPSRVSIRINNMLRFNNLTSDYDNLDITKYMETGKWNKIELIPNGLGRIDATVFVQALMNFDK